MELRARVVVEGMWKGLHRSPYHGFSVEFSEYRQYVQGDDPRYIDWKVYARSDRHYIKKFEDETNLRCHLFVDQSRSMEFGSKDYNKTDYGNTVAATLAYFLMSQGDAVGLTTFHEEIAERLPPRNRPGHLRRLMLMLEQDCQGNATGLDGMLEKMPQLLRKRGMVVLISDFLVPLERIQAGLRTLQATRQDVVLFQILDPAERDFSFEEATHFRDAETGQEFFIDPQQARSRYLKQFEEHLEGIRTTALQCGMDHYLLGTDDHVESALWHFITRRQQVGAVSSRSRRNKQAG